MKRYIQSAMVSPLKEEADKVFRKLNVYPDVLRMSYDDETEAYCIEFNQDAEDVGWIWDEMEKLGYKSSGQDEDAIYWNKGNKFRAWMYEDPVLELYITH